MDEQFGSCGTVWDNGDSIGDGSTGFSDLVPLGQNCGVSRNIT